MIREQFPSMPKFSLSEIAKAQENCDFMPLLFEWYKYVGLCSNLFASIHYEPYYFIKIPPLHYGVLIGHLNRIAKLMVSNVRLGYEGRYGEAIFILSRCIFETTVNLRYLCKNYSPHLIKMFLADAVKKDIDLKIEIQKNILARHDKTMEIEKRMLASIQRTIDSTEMSETQIIGQKKWPDLRTICKSLDLNDVVYVSLQKMGSHSVHGTWTDLASNYLEKEEEIWHPKDLISPHVNCFGTFPLLVVDAIFDYVNFLFKDKDSLEEASEFICEIRSKLLEVYSLGFGNDFERA